VNLQTLLNAILTEVNVPQNIEVHMRRDKTLPEVHADGQHIKRVFFNLINNAVQAMPDGGTLTVKTRKLKTAEDAGIILVQVEDTGMGIPENIKSKLFKPLFTTKSRGQGFGLAVSKRIIEAHGGTISFQSEEGKGTQFTVELPIKGSKSA
jgi:signal transduction histidine kinase